MSTPTIPHWLDRQCTLIGADACARLGAKTVMVVGLGGVGGHAVEALARTGIGHLILVDPDTISDPVSYPSDEVLSNGSSYAYLPEDISRFVESLFMDVRNS